MLRKIHELDYESIARTLDCSADSARAHVFQALRKIRHTLNGHDIGGRPGAGASTSGASEGEITS